MAVLEGLAHGLAVVTTRVGAHEETITDGVDGVFVPVGDADALAAALARLVDAPDECRRLGATARATYLERFSIDSYMLRVAAIYASLRPPARVGATAPSGPSIS